MSPSRLPDTPIATAALELTRAVSPPFLLHHGLRSFGFALSLARRERLAVDGELLFLGAVMHDLGLTKTFGDGEESFQIRGARASREFLLARGYDPERAQIIHEAIADHLDPAVEQRRPEIALVRIGAGVDILGLHLDVLPEAEIQRTLEQWPRLDFKHRFGDLLRCEAHAHPSSPLAGLVAGGLLEGLDRTPFAD